MHDEASPSTSPPPQQMSLLSAKRLSVADGRTRTYKTGMLLMTASLLAAFLSLLVDALFCQSLTVADEMEGCADLWIGTLFPILSAVAGLAAVSICGCCGCGLGRSSWRFCMRDETYKRINSLFVVIFGGATAVLIWPLLMSAVLENTLGPAFLFSLVVLLISWSCLSCCTKAERSNGSHGSEEEEHERQRVQVRRTIWNVVRAMPLIIVVIFGTEVMNIR